MIKDSIPFTYMAARALNLHFSENADYDAVKYKFVMRRDKESFLKDRFRYQYEYMDRKFSGLSKPQIIYKFWEVYKRTGFKPVYNHNSLVNMLTRAGSSSFNNAVSRFSDEFSLYLKRGDIYNTGSLYPKVWEMHLDGKISIETVLMLDKYVRPFLKEECSHDIVSWPSKIKILKKAQTVINYILQTEIQNIVNREIK